MPIYRIGGSLSANEKAENARRRAALEEARIAAIIKHGVQDEYIEKAKAENQRHEAQINARLADIQENDEFVARLKKSK